MKKEKMIRTQICLTKNEKIKLENESTTLGISMAELLRRIIDNYIGEKQNG